MLRKSSKGIYLLESTDISIRSRSGKEVRAACPVCSATRHHPDDPSLSVDTTTGAGFCHHCHEHFMVTDYSEGLVHDKTIRTMPAAVSSDLMKGVVPLTSHCREYLASRGIDPGVAAAAGVGSITINGVQWLAFPFYENGKVVNVQYKRADSRNKEFRFSQGGKMVPWNADCILRGDGTTPLYITEGMMDAVALMQSGFQSVVSVPNGAGSRMEVFDGLKELITRNFTHIVFAGDTDAAGLGLRASVTDYFAGTDVAVVSWHWRDCDVKDANDMLMSGGTEAVAFCLRNAVFGSACSYSVASAGDSALINLYRNGRPKGKGISLASADKLIKYLPGCMYVVSGYPGTGKSTFIDYVTMSLLSLYGWRTLFYSPEKMPVENHLSELIEVLVGKSFDGGSMSESDMMMAAEYLSGNVMHIDDTTDDLDKILKIAASIVRRHGIKVFVIDPFMYLAIKNLGGMSETTKITEMLKKIRSFARDYNVVVMVVAHPRKPNANAQHPSLTEMLYEIAGSSGFFNTCDAGIFLERPDASSPCLKIMCCKSRNSDICHVGETVIEFVPERHRYTEVNSPGKVSSLFTNWTEKPIYFQRENVSSYECDAPF